MSMWFQRLYGDTSSFAIRVTLSGDPHPAEGIDAALRESWGTLAIWACGRNITRAELEEDVVEGPTWYLLPWLEWLARSARFVLNEEPFPGVTRRDGVGSAVDWLDASDHPAATLSEAEELPWAVARHEWRGRHGVRAGLAGAVGPQVMLRRSGHLLEVSWDNERWPANRRGVRYLEPFGATHVPLCATEAVLRSLLVELKDVLSRRSGRTVLEELSSSLSPSAEDWELLVPRRVADIVRHSDFLRERALGGAGQANAELVRPHNTATWLLRSFSPGTATIAEEVVKAAETSAHHVWPATLQKLRRPAPPPARRPWEAGYEAAIDFRASLGLEDKPFDVFRWLGEQKLPLVKASLEAPIDGGAAVLGSGRHPRIFVNDKGPRARSWKSQMMSATGLGHLLLDAPEGMDFGVTHGSWWEPWASAARARAFAAMLLMPVDGIEQAASEAGRIDRGVLKKVSSHFGVGPSAASWHMKNLGLITEEERVELATPR